ncbi:hypothetical protein MNBD_CPR01-170 [hydrothermal vent metagenome]|uniref:DUF1003 domain-containing protein n=1 Tax=hydrothermal vent metagenome TaxID=652676 RepID=A0A3B0VMA6_9ZZZZ
MTTPAPTQGREQMPIDKLIIWIGSISSIVVHTIIFIFFFALSLFGIMSWQLMLLVLTTTVSLEAIYLAIFIQLTVNRNARELQEVSEDIDEISEDIDEIGEDIDEMSEEDERDSVTRARQEEALDVLTNDVRRVLSDLEALKQSR